MNQVNYPHWVCHACASESGASVADLATFHEDICDVCNDWKSVTESRDYGYPKDLLRSWDPDKIRKELTMACIHYLIMRQYPAAQEIARRLEQNEPIIKERR